MHAVQAGGAWAIANPALIGLGTAAAAAAGAVAYLVYQTREAAEAVRSIQLAAAVAGFDVTTAAAAKLRDSIEQLANVSASNASAIANAFAPLGPVGETVAQLVAPHLQNLADSMGKKIPEAADELAKSFINSDTAGKRLIESSRVLSQSQKEQYAAFTSSGDRIGQYGLLVLELNNRLGAFERQQAAAGAATRSFSEDVAIAAAAEGGFDIAEQVMSAQLARTTQDIEGQERALGLLLLQLAMTANEAGRTSAALAKTTADEIRAHDLTFKGPDVKRLTEDRASEQALAVNPDATIDARKEASLKVLEYDKQINAAEYADFKAAEDLKVAAAGKNTALVIQYREQEAARARELFGAGSNEERAAIEAVARAKEEAANRGAAAAKSAAKDELGAAEEGIKGQIAALERHTAAVIDHLGVELKLHQITAQAEVAAVVAALAQEKSAGDALYAQEAALAGLSLTKKKEIADEQQALDDKVAEKMFDAQAKAAEKTEQAWDKATSGINSAFDSQISGLLKGTETLRAAFKNVAADLTEQLIKSGLNSALTGIENIGKGALGIGQTATQDVALTTNTAALTTLNGAMAALIATLTGNTAVTSAQATSTLANTVSTDANTIATNFQAAIAGISSLIPKFASGTPFVPHNMLALIHQGEMVVPAHMNPNNPANSNSLGGGSFSNPVAAGGQSGATGGGGGVTHNHNYGGVHIDTGGRELDPDALASAIQKAHRGGHFNRR